MTGDYDVLARLAAAQQEAHAIAERLFDRTSKREERADFARRLNALAASLRTIELRLGGDDDRSTNDLSLRPRPGESAEDVIERVTRAAKGMR